MPIRPRGRRRVIKPFQLICLSFLSLIIVGTALLMLPFSSNSFTFTSPLDAAYTATSATCVTGLVVQDTYTYWSPIGKLIILLLIQLGGLGIVSFTTFFQMLLRKRLDLRTMRIAHEQNASNDIGDVQLLFSRIIQVTFFCETVGALLLMCSFIPKFGANGIGYAIFIAISSYCNAGFDVFGFIMPFGSLHPFINDPIVMIVVPALIITGGLGFFVYHDILSFLKDRHNNPSITLHTKIVLITTAVILLCGFTIICLSEWNQTLAGYTPFQKIEAAFFSAATSRTAGYSVIDYSCAHRVTLLTTMAMMFIGASPGSTGGGIKTTTLVIIIMMVYNLIRGRSDTTIFKRRVDYSIVYKAVAIAFLSCVLLGAALIIMTITNPNQRILDLAFEAISAFSTTGLSSVGSQNLDHIAQIISIILMYIGRIGPLSFILLIKIKPNYKNNDITYPFGRVFVG